MRDINPLKIGVQGITPGDIKQFHQVLNQVEKGQSVELRNWRVLNASETSGGLGGFTVIFNGILSKDKNEDSKWSFKGTMQFYDNWNFKSHDQAVKSGEKDYRSPQGDELTTLARKYLPGQPFDVKSEVVEVNQTSDSSFVSWFNGYTPMDVPNRVYKSKDLIKMVKKDVKR